MKIDKKITEMDSNKTSVDFNDLYINENKKFGE